MIKCFATRSLFCFAVIWCRKLSDYALRRARREGFIGSFFERFGSRSLVRATLNVGMIECSRLRGKACAGLSSGFVFAVLAGP